MLKNEPVQEAFKALSDPTRRAVLNALKDGAMSAGELAEKLSASPTALSHHFNVLRAAGLVKSERRGQSIFYSLNKDLLKDVAGSLTSILGAKLSQIGRKRARKA